MKCQTLHDTECTPNNVHLFQQLINKLKQLHPSWPTVYCAPYRKSIFINISTIKLKHFNHTGQASQPAILSRQACRMSRFRAKTSPRANYQRKNACWLHICFLPCFFWTLLILRDDKPFSHSNGQHSLKRQVRFDSRKTKAHRAVGWACAVGTQNARALTKVDFLWWEIRNRRILKVLIVML